MIPALVVVCFILIVGVAVLGAVKYAKKAQQNFLALAAQLGLTPVEVVKKIGIAWSNPSAAGEIRGRPARVFNYSTGSGKSRTQWCAFSVVPRETGGLTFQISTQGLGSKILQVFGSREIEVGDPAFDAKWFIQTNQPEFLQAALIPELRDRMTAALSGFGRVRSPSFKLESNTILYSESATFGNEFCCGRIAGLREVMMDLADVAEVFAQQSKITGKSERS